MDQKKIGKIKQAVKANFEQSPEAYQSFEDEYAFFHELNGLLLSSMKIPSGAHVLDVGCGTGASSAQIMAAIPGCKVWGIDISPAMLDKARARVGDSDRMKFVEGDAGRLTDYFDHGFDAIVYSASIFLIPDYSESLRQARELLNGGGTVGLSFMDGVYDSDGNNALAIADKDGSIGVSLKKPVDIAVFQDSFAATFPENTVWNEDFRLPMEQFRGFFSVPAMSAGLFPRLEYRERLGKVDELFRRLPGGNLLFRWLLMTGRAA
jgi:ubiquinone/menaquinone biosynthesis C-methylase UbiE